MVNRVLDHLEEWIITFLMGAATVVIFVAVIHRYLTGFDIPVVQDALLKIDLSWAQELCIYMFVWMAKFGAAYGVRTGIHVGVDVLINRMEDRNRARMVIFGLLAILAGLAIVPKEAVEKLGASGFARTPIGSGPFKFVEFVADDHVKLVRNDHYWKKPNLKEVVFRVIPDGSVAVLSLQAGDVDAALDIPTTEVDRLSANKRIQLHRSQLGYYRGIGFNLKKAPFDELRVRKAIAMAMDVDGAVNVVRPHTDEVAADKPRPCIGEVIPRDGPALVAVW
jgi:TRAP-type C4-dicarboxylate transport system permease small subunit